MQQVHRASERHGRGWFGNCLTIKKTITFPIHHHSTCEGHMRQLTSLFSRWRIATKLLVLFTIFGVLPMTAVGLITWKASQDMETGVALRFQTTSEEIADKIDRNLFERYGDVQAFGLNEAVQSVSEWYNPSEYNTISQIMDKYVKAYGIYRLTILVDTKGDVIAVNKKDAQGNRIDSGFLYKKNFSRAPWFQALEAGRFTTKQPFTAPGNDGSTGTFIEDVHIDADVKQAYPGTDGLTIGFSAPVYGEHG